MDCVGSVSHRDTRSAAGVAACGAERLEATGEKDVFTELHLLTSQTIYKLPGSKL